MKRNNIIISIIIISGLIFIAACDELLDIVDNTTHTTIEVVKTGGVDVGDTVRLEGTFIEGEAPLIVDEPMKLMRNTPLEEDSYIRLDISSLNEYADEITMGQIIEVKAVIIEFESAADRTNAELIGGAYLRGLKLIDKPSVKGETEVDLSWFRPIGSICQLNPQICESISETLKSDSYALLYSGGCNSASNYGRYWNDLKFIYLTLINKYSYDPDHIKVVYADGTQEDSEMPVDFDASATGLNDAFAELQAEVDFNDKFFVFTTNHGGGYLTSESANKSGLNDTDGDENDTESIDETMCRYNSATLLRDDEFADLVNSINAGRMIMVFEPCFSGGFLADVSGENRVVMSAATENEYSWSYSGGGYDEFVYHFTSAVNGNDPDGNSVDADSNNDGVVSMLEAFNYASTNDAASETPQYDDDGDGVTTANPSASGSGDGQFGSTITL